MYIDFTNEEAKLPTTDLIPGAIYESLLPLFEGIVDDNGNDEQSGIENGGGIRSRYVESKMNWLGFIVIVNTLGTDYRDKYNPDSHILEYLGDNNKKNRDPLDTRKNGSRNLKYQFDFINESTNVVKAKNVCPVLYFESVIPNKKQKRFIGIAYPDISLYDNGMELMEDGEIKNYKFRFKVEQTRVTKSWLYDLLKGDKLSENAPESWRHFYKTKKTNNNEMISESENTPYIAVNHNHSKLINTSMQIEESRERRGQNQIRRELLSLRGKCELCGISNENLLVASHILPWSDFEDYRGDLNNLMLLCANHDKLLDRHLICFGYETGKIMISPEIEEREYEELNINTNMKIEMNEQRKEIFKKYKVLFRD